MSKYGYNGTKDKDSFDKVRCSFCGKPRSEVKKLIAGAGRSWRRTWPASALPMPPLS